jgi:LysR family transcriptional regulator, nitrogen assimilation regulatory protein
MDLRQIRSFVAAYEEGSINRAAHRLNTAQPSLSVQLRGLEESLGVSLFERHPRGVRATPEGNRFYEHCLGILGSVENAEQDMHDWSHGDSGSLHIGLIPTVTKGALPHILPDFTTDLPNVQIRVVEAFSGTLTDWVVDGQLDFAVVTRPASQTGLEMRVLSTEQLALVSGPRSSFEHLRPVKLHELPPIKLVMPSPQHSLRSMLEQYIQLGNISVENLIEMDGLFGELDFIRNSDWSAILPISTVIADLGKGELVVNPIVEPLTTFEFFLVHQTRHPLRQPARELVERLESTLQGNATAWQKLTGSDT